MGWLRLLAQDYAFVQSRSRGGDLLGHGPRYDSHSTRADHSTAMASKIEARRFSGKPGTWAHYEMAVRAHLAVVDLIEFLHDGDGLVDQAIKLIGSKASKRFILISSSLVTTARPPHFCPLTPPRTTLAG